MKLYYSPGTCALAPHIAAHEAGIGVELEKVDLREKRTESGRDYRDINPLGSVPALEVDGELLTENAVILQYLAAQAPAAGLAPFGDDWARWRFLSLLNFIATELHKGFSQLFAKPPPEWRDKARARIDERLALLEVKLDGRPYLLGDEFTVADAYAFVILLWARKFEFDLARWPRLETYLQRMYARPAVQQALREEGLPTSEKQ
jgi:glutathione S-transferase